MPAAAPLTLGGGTFQLSGRPNGTATAAITGTWSSGASLITAVSSTTGLAPGQSVSGSGIPTGAYIVSVLTGLPGITGNQLVISANTTAAGAAAAVTLTTTNSWSTAQSFAGLTLNAGGSGVTVNLNGGTASVLNLGAITVTAGGTVNFTLPTGTQSATNGVTTSALNANGILGGWARAGDNWATNSTNAAGGNVVALASYSDVSVLGGSITSAAGSNLRVITGGTSGNMTPAAAGTTELNTLLQNATSAAIYDPGTSDVLRLGAAGGILVASGAEALTIGASGNDGILTAGGAPNTAGTVYVANHSASKNLSLNSVIADNGTGAVALTTAGPGRIILYGTNTFSGKTVVGGGTLEVSLESRLGTTPAGFVADQLTLAGGVFQATGSYSLSANRGLTLAAAGGTISVNSAATLTVAGVITGPGDLSVSGSGTLALAAANTFSGQTYNNAGTLALGHINALQNSTLVRNSGALTFTAAAGSTYNIGGLAGGNYPIVLGSNTIRVGANNSTNTYSGAISGSGGLIKVGVGTLQLTAASTFSGDTVVSGGMLVLAHGDALAGSTLDTSAVGGQSVNLTMPEGTLYNLGGLKGKADLDMAVCNLSIGANNQATTFDGALKGAYDNSLIKVGAGKLTLAGPVSYLGTTTVSGGTLEFSGSKSYANDITVNSGCYLALTSTGSLKFIVTDSGNNRVTGSGTATLNGTIAIATSAVAATTSAGTWTLVNATGKSFGTSFAVTGFAANADGSTWTKTDSPTRIWSFSEATGVLTLLDAYHSWIAGYDFTALPGADLTATGDPDHDGIPNGVEYVIGNAPNQTKMDNLPAGRLVHVAVGADPAALDYLKFSYRRSAASVTAGVVATVQYDTTLAGPWSSASNGSAGVHIVETANPGLPGTDVDVYIPRGAAPKLFGRLSVVVP